MSRFLIPFLVLPAVAFAAGGGGETDIVERTINFIIYVALFYYLAADKIKAIFVARREGIAAELEKVQLKLKESKKSKEQAQKRFEEAQRMAEDMVATAKKEVVLLTQKVEESTKSDIENLIRHYNDSMEFEKRRAEKAVIDEILAELLESDATKLDKSAYGEILLKRVA